MPQCRQDEICKEITDTPGEFLVNPICQCPSQMSCPSVAPKNVELMVYDKQVCTCLHTCESKTQRKLFFSTEFFSSSANDNKFLKITYMYSISFYEFTVQWFNGKLFVLHMPYSTLEKAHCSVPEDHNLTVTGPSL